ncbi:hypothetical protein LCGC14_2205140 [marine sediment metagenome]|uniref:Uncharacterized protein n=1 Tax=marine sediment metagenome TaxID=412755 RepID=A0A0F9DFR2_9ZZZZ
MTKGRERRAQKRQRREVRNKKRPAAWSQRTDPDIPSYNLVTFRVYGSPMPEHRYEGRAAIERLGRFVDGFSAGRANGRRGLPPNDRFTPTWKLPDRMQRLREDAKKLSHDGVPKPDKIAFVTIGRWRFGLSFNGDLWTFSAQLVDDGKATNADEQRLAAAVDALGVPDDVEPSSMGKSRYYIWRQG